jgi:hypothetical protein
VDVGYVLHRQSMQPSLGGEKEVPVVPSVLGSPPIAAMSTLFQSIETFLQGDKEQEKEVSEWMSTAHCHYVCCQSSRQLITSE